MEEDQDQDVLCKGCGKGFPSSSILRHISHAKYCKSQTPAIYTRVASYLDWINEFITEANG